MSDIVKKLRNASASPARNTMGVGEHWNLHDEAADEIERLKAENNMTIKMAAAAVLEGCPDDGGPVELALRRAWERVIRLSDIPIYPGEPRVTTKDTGGA